MADGVLFKLNNMKFNQKKFASDILQRRIDGNLSVEKAAKETGVSRYTIYRLEKDGDLPPNMDTLCLLCGWMGVNPGVYFDEKISENDNS